MSTAAEQEILFNDVWPDASFRAQIAIEQADNPEVELCLALYATNYTGRVQRLPIALPLDSLVKIGERLAEIGRAYEAVHGVRTR